MILRYRGYERKRKREAKKLACKYKNECPSYSGWCNVMKHPDGSCVPFLLTAYENEKDARLAEREEQKSMANAVYFSVMKAIQTWHKEKNSSTYKDLILGDDLVLMPGKLPIRLDRGDWNEHEWAIIEKVLGLTKSTKIIIKGLSVYSDGWDTYGIEE